MLRIVATTAMTFSIAPLGLCVADEPTADKPVAGVSAADQMAADQMGDGEIGPAAMVSSERTSLRGSRSKYGVVSILPLVGQRVRGTIRFVQDGDVIQVSGKLNNLAPGRHRLTVHRFGDLRSRDGSSTGVVLKNGVIGFLVAGDNGVAAIELEIEVGPLDRFIGRSILVNGTGEDLREDPTGENGRAVAHGVIGIGNIQWSYLKNR